MAQPFPSAGAQAHIEGQISGQAAVGNYNVQIGSVHGGVVNLVTGGQQPRPRPRPTPVFLRPRPFADLLDRDAEIDTASDALRAALPVEFHGQGVIDKTALLRHLAHRSLDVPFPDGVVYLSARHQPRPTPTPDTVGPTISTVTRSDDPIYWPPEGCEPNQVTVRAYVSNPEGISRVSLIYWVTSGTREGDRRGLTMSQASPNAYEATVGARELEASLLRPAPATLYYYIEAFDRRGNRSQVPTGTVTVELCSPR